MKLSELDPSKEIKVLVYGEAGSGKTVFGCSFPTPIFVADFDAKVSSAAAYYKSIGATDRIEQIDYETYTKQGDTDIAFDRWSRKLYEFEQAVKKGEPIPATIVLDSLTFYVERAMEKVIDSNPGVKGPVANDKLVPGRQHYLILGPHFKAQLARILNLPCHVVITAHVKTTQDDTTGEIHRGPAISPSLAAYLPALFPEVYRSYAETKGNETRYLAQTKPDFKFKAIRSQIPGLTNPCVLGFNSLVKPLATLK